MGWRQVQRVSAERWRKVVERYGGPAELAGPEAYAAAGPWPSLALAMLVVESKCGTAFNRNRPANKNPLNLRPPGGVGYLAFPRWTEGVRMWYLRLSHPTYKDGVYTRTETLAELVHVYAPASDDNDEAAYVATIRELWRSWGVEEELDTQPRKPAVLHIAGHRSTGDPGNPEEKAFTDDLAREADKAFGLAGFVSKWLQAEVDGDSLPDMTEGGLDRVSALAAQWVAATPGPVVVLDWHLEGAPAPGCFAIVPDVEGLGTAIAGGAPAADTWEANRLDQAVGRAFVAELAKRTGLTLRQGIREPGLMDEDQTGVAQQYGARLATFAYTAPYQARAVRLVLECGNHTVQPDRSIIFGPGFAAKAAAAAVAAVTKAYGLSSGSGYAPALPIAGEVRPRHLGGELYLLPSRRRWRAKEEAPQRQGPSPERPAVATPIKRGQVATFDYLCEGAGELWLVAKAGRYVRAEHFV